MQNKHIIQIFLTGSVLFGCLAVNPVLAQQSSAVLKKEFPELATFIDAFKVTQGAMLQQAVSISESPANADARNHLSHMLAMNAKKMTSHSMMSMQSEGSMDGMSIGPFGKVEMDAAEGLMGLVESQHKQSAVRKAFANVPSISRSVENVIERGHSFQGQVYDIYANKMLTAKAKEDAVNAAIDDYLKDENAVTDQPKDPALLDGHPYDNAFKTAFPEFNGLNWTTQWLEFASLQALMVQGSEPKFDGSVNTVVERFNTKVNGLASPIPTERPMAPVIAPLLYHRHPRAAIILDNLNMFKMAVADILVHPSVENKDRVMQQVVNEFTSPTNLLDNSDYLYWALRGGLFNQGGPAVGVTLSRSERNRTRAEMGMQHSMIMKVPAP